MWKKVAVWRLTVVLVDHWACGSEGVADDVPLSVPLSCCWGWLRVAL